MTKKRRASRNDKFIIKCDKYLLDNVERLIATKRCNKRQLQNLEILRDAIIDDNQIIQALSAL